MNVMSDDFTTDEDLKPKRGNNGGGRRKINIDLAQIEAHAARGLTLEDIALCMGFSAATLHNRKAQDQEIRDAIARGRALGQKTVASALFKAAQAGHVEAAKFYLARRCDWRETVNQEVGGKGGAPIGIQVTITKEDGDL